MQPFDHASCPSSRHEDANIRTLVASTIDGILILKNDTIIDCNRRILDMFGCRHEDMIGTSPVDWSPTHQDGNVGTADQMRKNLATAHKNQVLFLNGSICAKMAPLFTRKFACTVSTPTVPVT